MANRFFDLFGNPSDAHHGAKGRPSHPATDENRNKIMLLQALGRNRAQLARAIGVCQKTLRRHYLPQLRLADAAADRLEAGMMLALMHEADAGNVAAIRELDRRMHRARIELADRLARGEPGTEKAVPKGKKEMAATAAQNAGADDPAWTGLLKS